MRLFVAGVSAQSFIHSFTLTSSTFNIFIATPEGKPMDFVDVDDTNRQWVADFSSKPISVPQRLETIDGKLTIYILLYNCNKPSGSLFRLYFRIN